MFLSFVCFGLIKGLLSGPMPPVAVLPLPFVLCLFPAPLVSAHQPGDAALMPGRLDPLTALLMANPRFGGGPVSAPLLDLEVQPAAYPTPPSQPSPSPSLPLLPAKHWHAHRL